VKSINVYFNTCVLRLCDITVVSADDQVYFFEDDKNMAITMIGKRGTCKSGYHH